MCIFCLLTDNDQNSNDKDILKSLVKNVEEQETLKKSVDTIRDRLEYCQNVKDSNGLAQVKTQIEEYNNNFGNIVFEQQTLIRRYVMTNNYNYKLN